MQLMSFPDDMQGSTDVVWSDDMGELDRVLAGFDFSMPESAVLGEQIPDGVLDLNVFDTSAYPLGQATLGMFALLLMRVLHINKLPVDSSGQDLAVSNWLISSDVASYPGVVDPTTVVPEYTEGSSQPPSTMRAQQQSEYPLFGLDEVQQLLSNGVELFPESLSNSNSQPSFGFEALQDLVTGASGAFNLDLNTSYHPIIREETTATSQAGTCQPTPEVVAAPMNPAQPSDCEVLIDSILKSDKQAKLAQLAKLREAKDRLAEEEKQLGKHSSDVNFLINI